MILKRNKLYYENVEAILKFIQPNSTIDKGTLTVSGTGRMASNINCASFYLYFFAR